jgi:hypothetical protein
MGRPRYVPLARKDRVLNTFVMRFSMKRSAIICASLCICLAAGCQGPEEPFGGYCVGSHLEDEDAFGGFGPCNNFPKPCKEDSIGKKGEVSLIAFPEKVVDFRNSKAIVLRLVNRTQTIQDFSACDSALCIVQEALGSDGQWRPLERLPSSFCGNSFHRVFLEPNEYWQMYGRLRRGSDTTRFRFRLDAGGGKYLYSNEYTGSI